MAVRSMSATLSQTTCNE